MKKFTLILLYILISTPTWAIFKEQDLNKTIYMLRHELEELEEAQPYHLKRFEERRKLYWEEMQDLLEENEELALVLYSQQTEFMFGMAHACHQIAKGVDKFKSIKFPVDDWRAGFELDIVRYEGMIVTLNEIADSLLTIQGKYDRAKSIKLATHIKQVLIEQRNTLAEDEWRYNEISRKMQRMDDYASQEFTHVRNRIFLNKGHKSYVSLLGDWENQWESMRYAMKACYGSAQQRSSEWMQRIRFITFIIVCAFIGSILLFWLLFQTLPQRYITRNMREKKWHILFTVSFVVVSIALLYLYFLVLQRNVFIVTTKLIIEYMWLLCAILLTTTIRLKPSQLKSATILYLPIILLSTIMLLIRIFFIPVSVIRMIMPIIFIITLLAQGLVMTKYHRMTSPWDRRYAIASIIALGMATILAWSGFNFLGLQLMMFWVSLLAGLLTLACLQMILTYRRKKEMRQTVKLRNNLLYYTLQRLVMPIGYVLVVFLCGLLAAQMFDMNDWLLEQHNYFFIDLPGVARISLSRIILVVCLGILVAYISFITRVVAREIYGDEKASTGSIALIVNLSTIFLWGIYLISVFLLFDINSSGIIAAVGGMGVGIGFALKDSINNLICGIMLMTGRVHLNDMVECDGVRGRIVNINYQSTILETIDGSLISFLNSQLFSKNFKNLTRNHGYEMSKILVGIAYGSDVDFVRKLILDVLSKNTNLAPNRDPSVFLNDFGDSSIDLSVIVWVPVNRRGTTLSELREAIYITLNEHNVTIPFPQRDVHVIKDLA